MTCVRCWRHRTQVMARPTRSVAREHVGSLTQGEGGADLGVSRPGQVLDPPVERDPDPLQLRTGGSVVPRRVETGAEPKVILRRPRPVEGDVLGEEPDDAEER